jgi:hypothetical protein
MAYVRDDILRYQLKSTVGAWELGPDGSYQEIEPAPGEFAYSAQELPGPPIPDAIFRGIPSIPRP